MKNFNKETYNLLSRPFDVNKLKFRIGSTSSNTAVPLVYIDARDVYDRLDEVLGCDGWQCENYTRDGKVTCDIHVMTDSGEWITKSNGAGDTNIEGDKGAFSDAVKRTAVLLGVGRYLYDIDLGYHPFETKTSSGKPSKYFSARTISELRKLMEEKSAALFGNKENVVPFREVGSYESTEGTTEVARTRDSATKIKKRIREEILPGIQNARNEEELLDVINANLDALAEAYSTDMDKNNVPNRINWYITNGNHEFVSLRDRILMRAIDFGCSTHVAAILAEHVETFNKDGELVG